MNIETQERVLSTGRLILSKKRLRQHYIGVVLLGLISASSFLFIMFSGLEFKWPVLIFLVFPLITIGTYLNQYSALKLKSISSGLTKSENYHTIKETLKTLKWSIRVDNKGFIEAVGNPPSMFSRTYGEDIISIIIADNKILINSIGNVDNSDWQVGLSFGKHTNNVKKFLEAFEILSQFQKRR